VRRFETHRNRCPHCVTSLSSYEATIRLAKGAFGHPDDALTEEFTYERVRVILVVHRRARR
jgi:hypothetical protein